jgi:hypothetical protein
MSTPGRTTSADSWLAVGSGVADDELPPALESRQPDKPAMATPRANIPAAEEDLTGSD